MRCSRKSSIIIEYGHQGVHAFREALSYCYWSGSMAVHEMEANQSLSRQSVFTVTPRSNQLYNLPCPLTARHGTWASIFIPDVFAAVATLPPPRLIGTARKYSSAVSMYSAYIHNRLSFHLALKCRPSIHVLVSLACKPTTGSHTGDHLRR